MKEWLLRQGTRSPVYLALAAVAALFGLMAAFYSWDAILFFGYAAVCVLQYFRPRTWGWIVTIAPCVAYTVALGYALAGQVLSQMRLPYSPGQVDKGTLAVFLLLLCASIWLLFEGPLWPAGDDGAGRPA